MASLHIGEVAARAGVNTQTLRYYERRGLLPEPERTPSNYRLYSEETIRRVRFIKHAQEIGFSLREIDELLALRIDSVATCADVQARAREKIADVEEKIAGLRRIKKVLERLAAECDDFKAPVVDCPILKTLDAEEEIP